MMGYSDELPARLHRKAYRSQAVALAPALIGCTLVRIAPDGTRLAGRIVETEAYAGPADQAAHTRNGHRSPRNETMWGDAGLCYVYFTYGMHHCMNVVCAGEEIPEAVLIRAIEPIDGLQDMHANRAGTKPRKKALTDRDLCSGPARLCQAMGIDLGLNGADMVSSGSIWIEKGGNPDQIVNTTRVGIDSSGPEWAGKPWRWYDGASVHVSRR